jgi:hypothetical protein
MKNENSEKKLYWKSELFKEFLVGILNFFNSSEINEKLFVRTFDLIRGVEVKNKFE